jgi:hypothetical protein
MRKLVFYTMTICLLFTFSPGDVKAVNSTPKSAIVAERLTEAEKVQAMLDRLQEIKAMDRKLLTSDQRKDLRKEVREIKQEMKAVTGIYISIGALVIIILLLILIL